MSNLRVVNGNPFSPGAEEATERQKENREKNDKLAKDVYKLLEKLEKSNNIDGQLNAIIALESKILPKLFDEFLSIAPNPDRSTIGAKFANVLKHMATMIIQRREMQVSEDVNPHSPKFQLIFTWFLEAIQDVMKQEDFGDATIDAFFNKLSLRLTGWEDKIGKQLKGISAKALRKAANPLLKK